ncbi:response regulator [Vibrio coralliilyticus]|uniref:hybrid sensor histidine kinase/response regulator n=1 Tax=Vibrio TaxID=662 RepID=UPI0004FFC921|nr:MULTISPECIES: hybrid sensor histidine kinase/response regulator [Vibrio]KFI10482.1 histidine kinase [Vibrio sp. B183]NOI16789.1 response regulator [Vibrio coralliilyticus]
MPDLLTNIQIHPAFLLLFVVASIVLTWSIYFAKTANRSNSVQLRKIKLPYLCYSLSILGWTLSNAFFYSPYLVSWGSNVAIGMALFANVTSYLAFANAYLVCLMLAKKEGEGSWREIAFLCTVSAIVLLANIGNHSMIRGITIDNVGMFNIHFGEGTNYFFLTVMVLILLSFKNVIRYARNAKPLQQLKSLYMLFGIGVFMLSTLAIHVVVPMLFEDFSLAWLPPALSITEMLLMGYALITSRFYSSRHIIHRLSAITLAVTVLLFPTLFVIRVLETENIVLVGLLFITITGISWKPLIGSCSRLASRIVFNDEYSPQDKLYQLENEFQVSTNQALRKVAAILGVNETSLQLLSNIQDETLYTSHLKGAGSVLIYEEIEESLPVPSKNVAHSLSKLYKKMSADNVAMVLPIYDHTNNMSHLLVARKKSDGRLFFSEEIQALQSVLKKVQGYINADRKVRQSQALANSIAHEMRNPLAQVQFQFENLALKLGNGTSRDELNRHVLDGKNAIERGKQLIDIILREVSDSSLEQEPAISTSIQPVIRTAVERYGFEDDKIKKRVILNIDQDFVVKINDTLFNFVLFNLMRNAIYYFDSYPDSTIEVRTIAGKYENYVIVRDTGPGIPEHLTKRIFDDFFSHNKSGGSGLGLGYCQRVMRAFGGSIRCYSQLGYYTEFHLSFPSISIAPPVKSVQGCSPYLHEELVEDKNSFISSLTHSIDKSDNHLILVVDDKEIQRSLVKLYLEQLGYDVVLANNGKVAIEIIHSNPIDLVFMDIQMPVMNGFEAASIIKRSYPTIPIIALSGESGERELNLISELMDGRLSKPTTKQALNQMLTSSLPVTTH